MNEYLFLISGSLLVVLSYLFSELFKRTNIPIVIMLISTGMLVNYLMHIYGVDGFDFFPYLQVLGVVGLIMIVLEGALDLEISKEKLPLMLKSITVAFLGLIAAVVIVAVMLHFFLLMNWTESILYAVPFAVISSAIVIPSLENLTKSAKEFLIYESVLSDILGILLFYFVVYVMDSDNIVSATALYSGGFLITIVASVAISIALIVLFRFIKVKAKLFLFLAILVLIYSIGKMLHLSALVLILVFGLILKNNKLVFRGFMKDWAVPAELKLMERSFHFITAETAFLLRTFFFFVFGLIISLNALADLNIIIISFFITSFLFMSRWLLMKIFAKEHVRPGFFIAPRGLITIMLYYSIPAAHTSEQFEVGILLWVILMSGAVMAWGLIGNKVYKWDKMHFDDGEPTLDLEESNPS